MIALLIFGLISSVYAAPLCNGSWHPQHHGHHQSYRGPWHFHNHSQFDNTDFIPANNSLPDLHKTMKDLNNTLTDFHKRIKSLNNMLTGLSYNLLNVVSQEGVVGNEYIITIPLSGFEKKDIVVKARKGYVSIQANHKYSEGNENDYSKSRALPDTVKLNGKWKYRGGILKISFPLKEGVETQTGLDQESVVVITTDLITELPTTGSEEVFGIDERIAT